MNSYHAAERCRTNAMLSGTSKKERLNGRHTSQKGRCDEIRLKVNDALAIPQTLIKQ